MSYETPTYYGLRVNNNLSDVIDKAAVLKRLTLNIGDLNIIRGAASADGATRSDLVAISGLEVPLYKTLDRYIGDTSLYKDILSRSAGVDTTLRGNLQVNGPIGGSAIRYQFVDYTVRINYTVGTGTFILNERITSSTNSAIIKEIGSGYVVVKDIVGDVSSGTFTGSYSGATLTVATIVQNKDLKYADISTSRVSAWSTASAGTPSDADPIFYGGQIKVSNGGVISVDKITWGEAAQPRLRRPDNTPITGEIPTHTITTTINGATVKLFAMKSIPFKVKGFFKRFDGTVRFNQAVPNSRISWRIVNTSNSSDTQFYPELGSTSESYLQYRAVTAAERQVEIFYHPDYITGLFLENMGITELPAAELPALANLFIQNNNIVDMPNIKTFAPNLQGLSMSLNNLHLGTTENLRKFTKELAERLPSSLTYLRMMGTMFGSVRQTNNAGDLITTGLGGLTTYSVIEKACPNLVTIDFSRGSGAYFGPDDYDPAAYLPSMPNSLVNYYASNNDFRAIPQRGVKDLPNLVNFFVNGNWNMTDPTFNLSSNNLVNVYIGYTGLPIPNLSNKPSLVTFECQNARSAGPLHSNASVDTSYKFNGCGSLQNLYLWHGQVSGFIPKFKGNPNLRHVDLYASWPLTGGRPDNGEHGYADGKTFVMYNDTFNDAKNIQFFRVLSNSLLVGKGFEENTFKNLPALYYLFWYSYGRTGSGSTDIALPDISSCPNLQYFIMPVNNFTGPVPSMASNNRIHYVDLAVNKLTGPVPAFNNRLSLYYVFLNDNLLSSFPGFENTPNMIFAYLHNNQIQGKIPMLGDTSKAPSLQRLYLFNNQLNGYTPGSFAGLTRIQFLDVSRNSLYEFDLNNIIDDLYTNYQNAPRGRVSINLFGQTNAVGYNPSSAGTEREAEINEKIAFLRSKGWTITIG